MINSFNLRDLDKDNILKNFFNVAKKSEDTLLISVSMANLLFLLKFHTKVEDIIVN